jgi:hypothetical protein
MKDWPLSNYPISIALLLLAVTATTLAISDEQLAERLAIYAYYFLVIGVAIRFIELWLPEDTLQRLNSAQKQLSIFSVYIKQHGSMYIRNTGILLKKMYGRLKLYLHKAFFEMRVRISDFKKQNPPESIHAHIQESGDMLKRQYLKLQRLHIIDPGKNIAIISDISRNIAIFLSVVLIISLIYGMAIAWGFVNGYVYSLIYGILGCFAFFVILRVRISDIKKQHPPELKHAQNGGMLKPQHLKLRLHIINPGKNIALISDISRNIAIYLSLFLLISLIYGMTIDWWFVKRYLYNLIYTILGCISFYILLRVRF